MLNALMCLALLSSPALAAAPRETPKAPGLSTHMLTLSLLLAYPPDYPADTHQGTPPTANVNKAIQDIKEFLPYTRYEVQDTVILRTAALNPLLAELGGPDGRYTANFQYQMTDEPGKLNVHKFVLVRRPSAPARNPEKDKDARPEPPPAREVISTAFSVDVGETIVVGTSRPNFPYNTALVLVLTVLPGQ